MGKPQQGVPNRDTFHRMNFLHQAARLMVPSAPTVARHLSSLAVAVARKAVLRVESRVKRAVCKRCAMPLVDGEGSSVRLRKKRLVVRCLSCGFVKRYGLEKVPWGDRPEALIASYVFDGRKEANGGSDEVKDTRSKAERRMDKLKERAGKKDGCAEGAVVADDEATSNVESNEECGEFVQVNVAKVEEQAGERNIGKPLDE